eukprot:5206549-Alexandrium_andersonii.AAC.1
MCRGQAADARRRHRCKMGQPGRNLQTHSRSQAKARTSSCCRRGAMGDCVRSRVREGATSPGCDVRDESKEHHLR